MQKIKLKLVEVFYGYQCNLSCRGCSSGSDLIKNTQYDPTIESIYQSIENLSKYVEADSIDLLGGELFLYWDKIELIVDKLRTHFPNTTIGMVTNGLQLNKFKDRLIELCKKYHPCKVYITDHFTLFSEDIIAKQYHKKLNNFLKNTHQTHTIIELYKPDVFKAGYYVNNTGKIKPYATNDPNGSYTNGCAMPYCHALVDSKLYKCSWFSILPSLLEIKGQIDDLDWKKYLNYKPVDLNNPTTAELIHFEQTQNSAISLCDMCSNNPNTMIKQIKHNVLP